MRILPLAAAMVIAATPALAGFTFGSIDGGTLSLEDWQGQPVLVVNTASLCGFAKQFDALQDLQDRYGPEGLVVLAVPTNDFRQELASDQEVKDYCATTFDLTLPMTTISHVRGEAAHPFYQWVKAETGFEPGWNFNKILLGPDGEVVATWGAPVDPMGEVITGAIEALLP